MKTISPVIVIVILLLATSDNFGQTHYHFTGQYVNRAEYRHGFSTLAASGQNPAFFISQRARLIGDITLKKVQFHFSIQDVRTWGSAPNLTPDTNGFLAVHEAWASIHLNDKVALKMGRQEIAYDEDRIFGNLDWAMQARRHDAALLKYYDSTSKAAIDIGFSYNQNSERQAGTTYTVPKNYKTFQYLYITKPIGNITASLLFLNNGIQFDESAIDPAFDTVTTIFSQTFGPRLAYKGQDEKLSWNLAGYYQTGKNDNNQSLSAYDVLGEVAYQASPAFSATAGFELISGTDESNSKPSESKSFTPFYGTNHRFNGYMDYFYVGNHVNSVGLRDFYLKSQLKREKIYYALAYHFFASMANITNDDNPTQNASASLGSEIDLTINYNFSSGVSFQMGYSQLFATETMSYLKDIPGGDDETNNWIYCMVIIKPNMPWPRTGLKL